MPPPQPVPPAAPPADADVPGVRETALAREPGRLRKLFKLLGPGLIAGASDDDPATVGTCATVGASVGYPILWTMPFAVPLMIAVQYLSAKVGLVTGRGLSGVLRKHYPRWVLVPAVLALAVAHTANAGADLGAIAASVELLVPGVSAGYVIVPFAVA